MTDKPPGDPLPYRNAADDRPASNPDVVRGIGGAVLGVAGVAFAGVCVGLRSLNLSGDGPRHLVPQAVGFGVAAAAAGVGLAFAWPHRGGRVVVVGCLIGVIVACLIAGTCFYNP